MPVFELFDVRIDRLTEDGVLEHLISSLREGQGGWVATHNVDILRQEVREPELRRLLAAADLSLADGMPLVWASRLQGTPLPARVPTSELVIPLAGAAAANGFSMFLLGDREDVARDAASNLVARVPGLRIAGTYSPPFGTELEPKELSEIVRYLTETGADIVVCAFGFPKQERLMVELQPRLPHVWFLAAGATLSMLAGRTPPAPGWMRRSGLEWVHRLRLEPRRLFGRYMVHDAPFAIRLLTIATARGLGNRSRIKPWASTEGDQSRRKPQRHEEYMSSGRSSSFSDPGHVAEPLDGSARGEDERLQRSALKDSQNGLEAKHVDGDDAARVRVAKDMK